MKLINNTKPINKSIEINNTLDKQLENSKNAKRTRTKYRRT